MPDAVIERRRPRRKLRRALIIAGLVVLVGAVLAVIAFFDVMNRVCGAGELSCHAVGG